MSINVVYHGHSNIEVHTSSARLAVDPFYTGNALADISADHANPTHILLTHAHSDHVGDTVAIAKRTKAPVICNFEMALYLQKKGAPTIAPINHGGAAHYPFGSITMTIAFHTSSFEDGTYGGQPGGFILELHDGPESARKTKTIYCAGDTALFGDMKLLGELYSIDLACLPIGDGFTMGPAHAIKAAEFLRAKKVLPIHYNTFPPIQQDVGAFAAELKSKTGIECAALHAGQTLEL